MCIQLYAFLHVYGCMVSVSSACWRDCSLNSVEADSVTGITLVVAFWGAVQPVFTWFT